MSHGFIFSSLFLSGTLLLTKARRPPDLSPQEPEGIKMRELADSDLVDLNVFESIFAELKTDYIDSFKVFEILNQEIPFLGNSFNGLVGTMGSDSPSIGDILDLTEFVSETIANRDNNATISIAEFQTELNGYFTDRASLESTSDGDAITVTSNSDAVTITFTARFGFSRSTSINPSGIFDATPDSVEIVTTANLDVEAYLEFNAQLQVGTSSTEISDVQANAILAASGTMDFTLALGMLDLDASGSAEASASVVLTYCSSSCDQSSLGSQLEDSNYYVSREASYSISGTAGIGIDFPGLEIDGGEASFTIVEDDIFDASPEVDVTGIEKSDFVIFSPRNGLTLVRLIDSALVRTQENEAFEINLPLANKKLSEILATGSLLTNQLLAIFAKVEDFDDRAVKSLTITAKGSVQDLQNGTSLEFWFLVNPSTTGDSILTVNPDYSLELDDFVNMHEAKCSFTVGTPDSSDDWVDLLRNGIDSCNDSLSACDDSSCTVSDAGDFSCSGCDVVVDVNDEDKVFISSVAYKDNIAQNVELMGLIKPDEDGPTSYHSFPVNSPVTPSLAPRFRNFDELEEKIEGAINNRNGVGPVDVDFIYVPKNNFSDPSRIQANLSFGVNLEIDGSMDASYGLGDLVDVSVENGTLAATASVDIGLSLAVLLEASDDECITVVGNACDGTTFDCNPSDTGTGKAGNAGIRLFIDGNTTDFTELNLDSDDKPSVQLESTLGSLATVNEKGTSLLAIKFNSSISSVEISVRKNCLDPDTQEVEISDVFECPTGTRSEFLPNDYGLIDQVLGKKKFQIAVGEVSIGAAFDISASARLVANLGGVIEVSADLDGSLSGSLILALNQGDTFLPFSDWLVALTSIFQPDKEGYIAGFFTAASTFSGTINGTVSVLDPFSFVPSLTVDGELSWTVDFLSDEAQTPEVTFDVDFPEIGDVRNLSFADIVNILAQALEFLVGSGDSDTVESCSGGLLATDIFTYRVPVIGTSVCDSASFLQVIVNAVNELVANNGTSTKTTFSALETKLETLLYDGIGGAPDVNIATTSDGVRSELTVEIALNWSFQEARSLSIDLEDIFQKSKASTTTDDGDDISELLGTIIPAEGDAEVIIEGGLEFRLGVGLEYARNTSKINPFIMGTTGLTATFFANGTAGFEASIGPFQGTFDAEFLVGSSSTEPVTLEAGLDDTKNYYLSVPGDTRDGFIEVSGPAGLVEQLEASFTGSLDLDVQAEVPLIDLEASIKARISDLGVFFRGGDDPSNLLDLNFNVTGPGLPKPSFVKLLLSDPQTVVDGVDDVFRTVGDAALGPQGIITTFDVPFIPGSISTAFGAGNANNIIEQARRKIVPTLQEKLVGTPEDEPADTLATSLARLMEEILDTVGILQEDESITVECFYYDEETKLLTSGDCTDESVTSLMWTIPFGQKFDFPLALDFSVSADKLPLSISFGGDGDSELPCLSIGWEFNFAFGFDESVGFFLFTDPDGEPEFQVEALLSVPDRNVDAKLYFLNAEITGLDLDVGAGLYVDLDKASALRYIETEDPNENKQYGRLTRTDFRNIVQVSELFQVSALAAATLDTENINLAVTLGGDFEEVEEWIPELNFRLAAQLRAQTGTGYNNTEERRQLGHEYARTRIGHLHEGSVHRALQLLRSLSTTDDTILDEDFIFGDCEVDVLEPGELVSCAKLLDVSLDMSKIQQLVHSILEKFVNDDKDGYLDEVVAPLEPLRARLPGISDIMDRDITVLDVAEIYIGTKSGVDTVRAIFKIYDAMSAFADQFDEPELLLASECDIPNNFTCCGGITGSDCDSAGDRQLVTETETIFVMTDAVGQPMSSAHVPERSLASCKDYDQLSDDCKESCSCDDLDGCKALKIKCKAKTIEGLSFPFLEDPMSLMELPQGGDIDLVRFEPPELVFAFQYEMSFILYSPPVVELVVGFEFSTRVKVGFNLDSSGIREAIDEDKPLKALNSFALVDTFDDVDEPMITLTATVYVLEDF